MPTIAELQERVEQVAERHDIELHDTEAVTEEMISIGTKVGYDREEVIDRYYHECEPFDILAARIQTE